MPGSISATVISTTQINVTATYSNPTASVTWIGYLFGNGTTRSISIGPRSTRSINAQYTGLSPGTTYSFTADAIRADGGSISTNNWPPGGYSTSATTFGDSSPPPPPPPPAPSFTDQTITNTWIKTRNFSEAPDRTVAANNATSYAIKYSSSGLNPTSWLTVNSSGQLSGLPVATGVYTFVVTATGSGGSVDSSLQTLTINPPGNRRNESSFNSDLVVTKRYDGVQWINVSNFKRFDGANWVDITN